MAREGSTFYAVNNQIRELRALMASIPTSTGALTNDVLRDWALSSSYSFTSATLDSDGVVTTASVSWPDGSPGTFTRTLKNSTFLTIDAYTVTHNNSNKTVTQPAVTRDANGNVTAQPAITIA
mgnify:CR=1 FL=1